MRFLWDPLILIYAFIARNTKQREKRHVPLSLAWEGRKPAYVEHFPRVRHLARHVHMCYLIPLCNPEEDSNGSSLYMKKLRDFKRLSNSPKVCSIVKDWMRVFSTQPTSYDKMALPALSLSHFWGYHCKNCSDYISKTFSHFQTYSVCNLDLPLSPALTFLGVNSLHYFKRESNHSFSALVNFPRQFKNLRNPRPYKN